MSRISDSEWHENLRKLEEAKHVLINGIVWACGTSVLAIALVCWLMGWEPPFNALLFVGLTVAMFVAVCIAKGQGRKWAGE